MRDECLVRVPHHLQDEHRIEVIEPPSCLDANAEFHSEALGGHITTIKNHYSSDIMCFIPEIKRNAVSTVFGKKIQRDPSSGCKKSKVIYNIWNLQYFIQRLFNDRQTKEPILYKHADFLL